MSKQRIAVIGAGNIGATLAARWVGAGHAVTFGARNPDDTGLRTRAESIGVSVATIEEAIGAAEVVLLAVPGTATADVVPRHGGALDGRIVIDATNSVGGAGPLNALGLIGKHAPDARAYRAFNSLGWENFADADYHGTTGDMLYSGPDGDARLVVEELIGDTGLRPIRVGDNDRVELVDNFVRLWFNLAFEQGLGRGVGFKVLTR